ncbi:MAG: S16 family serine protease [Candidatus Thermoplasmatota archaeon]
MKKLLAFVILLIFANSINAIPVNEWKKEIFYRNISLFAPAVAKNDDGYVGVLTEINVTMMNGSGNVFVTTKPMTQLDMQGSAKLAVFVACSLTGKDIKSYDFIFRVVSSSPIVGGPSAGAVMAIAAICLLENLSINDGVIMTGMINPDASIGPVGGILEKGNAAGSAGFKYFLIPKGQSIEYKTVEERIGFLTIYKKVAVNVSEELYKKYGMSVIEVEDINDALSYFTGYKIEEEKSDKLLISSDFYGKIMEPMAEEIIREAEELYNEAVDNRSKTSLPLGWPWYNPRSIVSNSLDAAKKNLDEAKNASYNEFYYYAISKAFQSKINSLFVIYACAYYNGKKIEEIRSEVEEIINKSIFDIEKAEVKGLESLQCIGSAQKRILEAKEYLNKSGDELEIIYNLAYACQRCFTAYWWMNLSNYFNESYIIDDAWIREIAEEYYSYAEDIFSYANILCQETGYSSNFINKASEAISRANEQKENFPAASLFNSLEAISNSNLAIETIGIDDLNDKLNRTKEMASYSIQKARSFGIEPILAISYNEFARSIENSDVLNSLIYYKDAYIIANTLCLSKGYKATNIEKVNLIAPPNEIKEEIQNKNQFFAVAFISLVGGIIIGLLFSSRRMEER